MLLSKNKNLNHLSYGFALKVLLDNEKMKMRVLEEMKK